MLFQFFFITLSHVCTTSSTHLRDKVVSLWHLPAPLEFLGESHQGPSPWDPELHHLIVTAAKAALDLEISQKLLVVE